MPQQRILIVDANSARVDNIKEEIFRANLAPPMSRENAQSAIMWTSINLCDLVVLCYELPDMNGLEALARMRTRQPGLPAVMIAETDSQAVAITAFRTGVVDFIPVADEFSSQVVQAAMRLAGESCADGDLEAAFRLDPTLAEIPADRLVPTYQNRLRTIGRQLDVYHYRSIMVLEVDGGFLVRGKSPGSRKPQALEFPDRDLPRLVQISVERRDEKRIASAVVSPVVPTGYEDLLRAIGYKLDLSSAESISICEFDDAIIVGGRWHGELSHSASMEPFWMCLHEHEVETLLNQAFNRRSGSRFRRDGVRNQQREGLRGFFRRLN